MVAPDTLLHILFWYPKVRQNHVLILVIQGGEYQNECGDVCGGGQIQTPITDLAFQVILVDRERAFVPLVHGHPTDGLFDPLIESKLAERILLGRILLGRLAGSFDFIQADRDAEGGVGFLPDLRICK